MRSRALIAISDLQYNSRTKEKCLKSGYKTREGNITQLAHQFYNSLSLRLSPETHVSIWPESEKCCTRCISELTVWTINQ